MGAEVRRRTPGVKQGLQVLTRRTGFGLASTVGADRASGGCAATEISRAVRVRGWVWTREVARAWREGGWRELGWREAGGGGCVGCLRRRTW